MSLKFLLALLILSVVASRAPSADGYKILAAYPFPGRSHFMLSDTLIKELLKRGHQVTYITPFSLKSQSLGSNYTEILVEPVYDFWNDIKHIFAADNLFEMTRMNFFDFLQMVAIIGEKTTDHALKIPKVRRIIDAKETEGVYDLLLTEQFYQEPFLVLAYKYNIPVITTSTLGYTSHMSQMMGLITPWSFVPHGFMPFTDHMTFFQRVTNSFYSLYEDLYRIYSYFPKMDKIVKAHFSHLPIQLPKVREMEKHISLMLLNSYAPLTTARPTVDNLITVGGLQIYPPKALPADMQKFLDDAKDGVIYFSLGSNVQSKDMPSDKLRMFLDVFRELKQRVVWKFENESISDLPPNVMVKKWMPQSDILAHPNIKVFLTHGGLFGTQEGVYHGVPLLGMPFYCDQHLNMNKAVLEGYGINLHFQSITKDMLKNAIHELIENPTYKQKVTRISEIFRDRPMGPRETAMYWIEYVIRHKGAPHMRSAGLDLNWFQFYLLDVIAFVAGAMVLIVILVVVLARFLFRRADISKKKQKKH